MSSWREQMRPRASTVTTVCTKVTEFTMLRRQFTQLIGAGAAVSALPALIRPARAADPLKVGFIYIGPIGDYGWSYQHEVARKAAVEHFGDQIKTTSVENVTEGPE